MYDYSHPAYARLAQIGKEITTQVKPKAIVVFSAHWRTGKSVIEINTSEQTSLVYDFYGFPSYYYKETYPNVGSKDIAGEVINALRSHDIGTLPVSRGLDHGVWASFKVVFDPETNPLSVPIVQASMLSSEDPHQHYAIGQKFSHLRSENIQIIVSGMAVHNLRNHFAMGDSRHILPYTSTFDEALKAAVETTPAE